MGPEPVRLNPDEQTRLVAFLDGELDEGEAKTVARSLAQSPEARREAEALKATWSMLDMLPRVRASEDLGSKTLTALSQLDLPVVPAAEPAAPDRRAFAIATAAAAAVLAAAIGFLAASRAWPDPGARLVRQLSLAEHLDEYRTAGSFDFLERLDESDAFDDAE